MWYLAEPFSNGTGNGGPASLPSAQTATGSAITTQAGWLRLNPGTLGGYAGHQAVVLDSAPIADAEVFLTVRFPSTGDDSVLSVFFRSAQKSPFDSQSGYFYQINQNSSTHGWTLADNYSYSNIGSAVTFTVSDNTAYKVRMQVLGTTIRSKMWAASSSEPTSWDVSFTDSTLSSAGYIVIHQGGGGGGSYVEIDNLYIGDTKQSPDGSGSGFLRLQDYRRGGRITNRPVIVRPSGQYRITSLVYSGSRYGAGPKILQQRPHPMPLLNQSTAFRSYVTFFPVAPNTDWTQTSEDSAGVSDAIVIERSQNYSNNAVPTDSITSSTGLVRSDVTGPTDSLVIDRSLVAVDLAGLVDSVSSGVLQTDLTGTTDLFAMVLSSVTVDTVGTQDPTALVQGKVSLDLAAPTDDPALSRLSVVADLAVPTDSTVVARTLSRTDETGTTDTSDVQTSSGPINYTQTPTEQAGLTDSVAFSIGSVVADPAGLLDASVLARSAVAGDLAVPTDSTVVLVQHFQAPVDAGTPTDSITWGWGSSPVEQSGLTDSATFVLGRGVVITDGSGATDFRRYDLASFITDSAGSTDPLNLSRNLVTLDSSGASDSASSQGSTQYIQTPTDSAGVVDAPSLALALSPSVESAGLTDPVAVTPGHQVSGQDVTSTTDPVSIGWAPVRVDSAGVTDPVRFTWNLGPVEPVTVVETRTWERAHFFSDVAIPRDTATVSQGFGLLATDIAGSGGWDPAVISKTWAISATDEAGAGEYFPFLDHLPAPADSAGLTDSVLLAPGRVEPVGVSDLVTLALGEVDLDGAGLTDPVTVAMNGGLSLLDTGNATDGISLAYGLARTDTGAPTDLVSVLRFNDQRATDGAGSVDTTSWNRSHLFEDFPIEQDSAAMSYGIVTSSPGGSSDSATYDRTSVAAESVGTTDLVLLSRQPSVVDQVSVADPAVIVLSVAYTDTNRVDTGDSAVVSLSISMTVLDSAGVSDFPNVANGVLRLVTVEGSLAPQTRIVASLASPGRLSAILGLPVPIVAQMAAQGRISVVLADPPRIVAHLEAQP